MYTSSFLILCIEFPVVRMRTKFFFQSARTTSKIERAPCLGSEKHLLGLHTVELLDVYLVVTN